MIRLANVLVADAPAAVTERLVHRLQQAGYHADSVDGDAALAARAAVERPDLILIGDAGHDGIAAATRLKADPATTDIPVVLLKSAPRAERVICALAAGCDDVIDVSADVTELIARLRPLLRLATMQAELRLRAGSAAGFGLDVAARPPPGDSRRPSILVAGDDPDQIDRLLAEDADVKAATDLFVAESLLERGGFDAAVLSTRGDKTDCLLAFAAQVRANPLLFNLPLVMVCAPGTAPARPYAFGISRMISRPVDPDLLRASVLALVRRQRLRWSLRGALAETLCPVTGDDATGTYGRAFLDVHLASRLAFALGHKRHLAVIVFVVSSLEGVRGHFGDEPAAQLFRQIGQWITGLVRAEDTVARLGDAEYCAILPDTALAEAEAVMHRIAGILSATDFAIPDVFEPIRAWLQVGAATAATGDDFARLIGRARTAFDGETR